MITYGRSEFGQPRKRRRRKTTLPSLRARILWTVGNLLLLTGIYLLLYVGGVHVQSDYMRLAARGDNDLPLPDVPPRSSALQPKPAQNIELQQVSPFNPPQLNGLAQVVSRVPNEGEQAHSATVSRVSIPSIGVDLKVLEVGWEVQETDSGPVAIWQVAEYAVGQHKGSANPGEGGNIVLAGHVGGYGLVFHDLYYVQPGDQIILYSQGEHYLYTVQERLILDEVGVSPEQRAANARAIEPTDHEVVTLVTCWPPEGEQAFTQRVVVRALPYAASRHDAEIESPGPWTIR